VYVDRHAGIGQRGEGDMMTLINRHATGATTSPCLSSSVICPNSPNQRTVTQTTTYTITYFCDPDGDFTSDGMNQNSGTGVNGTNSNLDNATLTLDDVLQQNGIAAIPSDPNVSTLTNLNCFNTTGSTGGTSETGGTVSSGVTGTGTNQSWFCSGSANIAVNPSGFATGVNAPDPGTNITISSPVSGAIFTGSRVIIKGAIDTVVAVSNVRITITTPTNITGISHLAQVNGKYFADEVQLAPGINTITAKVTYQNGTQNEVSVTVTGLNQQEMVKLTASPNVGVPTLKQSGLTTLDVHLVTTSTITVPISKYDWDFDGDGTVDLTCGSLADVTASFQQPGLYIPTVTVTDNVGNTYTATAVVNVLDTVQANDLFKGIWNGMKNSLIAGNTSKALNYLVPSVQLKFSTTFDTLKNTISQIANEMQDIEPMYVGDTVTKYRIRRDQMIDGQSKIITYYIYFNKDQDGQWKLDDF